MPLDPTTGPAVAATHWSNPELLRELNEAFDAARLALRTATENLVEAQAALLFAPSTVEMGSARIAADLTDMLRRLP